ncbi:MAG: anthranilate synthase component I [Candidatus Lindowbacteria bacterium]|nr:anthranilate synthase component I [Candidatus Lindowbacteria bacterium]
MSAIKNVYPKLEEFLELAKDATLIPLSVELHEDLLTPISAYYALVGEENGFLLESVEGGTKVGRYTFIGFDPWETITCDDRDPLEVIKEKMASYKIAQVDGVPPFVGGAVGYIGYDCIAFFEKRLAECVKNQPKAQGLDVPAASFMICGKLVIFDHLKKSLSVLIIARVPAGSDDASKTKVFEDTVSELESVLGKLNQDRSGNATPGRLSRFNEDREKKRTGYTAPPDGVVSNMTREHFIEMVNKAKEYIAAGDIFQVVLSQRFERDIQTTPFDIYRALRATNPSPYLYFFNFDDFNVVGSSPEVMVQLQDEKINLRPIAGTRRRGKNEQEDIVLEEELLADEKECAEHIMLVDLGRNDVGRVSKFGTVVVDKLMTVEKYSHVMHIVSNVVGDLPEGVESYDVIRSAFPAGTVSGAPKIRAMEIIAELEPDRRGPYAGAVGYVGFDGNSNSAITLRTILVKDSRAFVQAGAGIVYDSVPETEYDVAINKAAAMLAALEWAEEKES